MRNLRGVFWLLVIAGFWLLFAAGLVIIFVIRSVIDFLFWIIMPGLDDRFFEDTE